MDFGEAIAESALDIGAITLNPLDPYEWASHFRMPIYNDNRKHLRYWKNRRLITDGFKHQIEAESIEVEMVSGTTTAGIAPAASLAQALNVPINIFDGPKDELVCHYTPEYVWQLVDKIPKEDCDVIVSTCPAAIIPAVFAANKRELPFAYIREKQKGHGLKQQVEGILKPGEKIIVVDFYNGYSYLERPVSTPADEKIVGVGARKVLEDMGLTVAAVVSENIFPDYNGGPDLKGKKDKHIEDLVSTGGSCVKEIETYKSNGATVEFCNAIFSYDFPETLQKFEGVCKFNRLLGYDQLLEVALRKGKIKPEQHEMLAEWRKDPFNWGAKHGFPKVEKK
jgi:orotate phosphoribosyltransferase